MIQNAWLIVILPLLAFVLIIGITYRRPLWSAGVAIGAGAITLAQALVVLWGVARGQGAELSWNWFQVDQWQFELGVLVDPMSSLMYVVVSLVTLLVMVYSLGYMHGDPGFSRYYAFLSLFAFSMLGLVAANNLLQIFIFWELVGLCSYLLIGFWYDQKGVALSPSLAGMRAFIVTRIGDVGFLLGILLLASAVPTLNFAGVEHAVEAGQVGAGLVTAAAVLLFAGAVGKSAQFPLHVWLPDAMEGPTPVSALIHAATMVAAGVYLVARLMGIFHSSPEALLVVAYIGGITAFLAASIALAITDFKRVIGYSTISQLGYMMLGLGVSGSAAVGMFHLTTHAFFKALLFLAIGAVIHTAHSQDMKDLGGLRKEMPITSLVFLLAALALAGVPPFAGFWSKDEIIHAALASGQTGLGVLGLVVAFMTAFYIFRVYFHTFGGEKTAHLQKQHLHEAPASMTVPMVVLAVLAVLGGLVGTPWANYFGEFMGNHGEAGSVDAGTIMLMGVSTLLALAGIGLAWLLYGRRWSAEDPLAQRFPGLMNFLRNKWYIENFYYNVIIRYLVVGVAYLAALLDRGLVDGLVNGVAASVGLMGAGFRRLQSGYLQRYAIIFLAAVVLGALYVVY